MCGITRIVIPGNYVPVPLLLIYQNHFRILLPVTPPYPLCWLPAAFHPRTISLTFPQTSTPAVDRPDIGILFHSGEPLISCSRLLTFPSTSAVEPDIGIIFIQASLTYRSSCLLPHFALDRCSYSISESLLNLASHPRPPFFQIPHNFVFFVVYLIASGL